MSNVANLVEQDNGHRRQTLASPDPAHCLVSLPLDGDARPGDAKQRRHALGHISNPGSDTRALRDDYHVHVDDLVVSFLDETNGLGQELHRVGTLPASFSVREVMTDIAKGRRTQ